MVDRDHGAQLLEIQTPGLHRFEGKSRDAKAAKYRGPWEAQRFPTPVFEKV